MSASPSIMTSPPSVPSKTLVGRKKFATPSSSSSPQFQNTPLLSASKLREPTPPKTMPNLKPNKTANSSLSRPATTSKVILAKRRKQQQQVPSVIQSASPPPEDDFRNQLSSTLGDSFQRQFGHLLDDEDDNTTANLLSSQESVMTSSTSSSLESMEDDSYLKVKVPSTKTPGSSRSNTKTPVHDNTTSKQGFTSPPMTTTTATTGNRSKFRSPEAMQWMQNIVGNTTTPMVNATKSSNASKTPVVAPSSAVSQEKVAGDTLDVGTATKTSAPIDDKPTSSPPKPEVTQPTPPPLPVSPPAPSTAVVGNENAPSPKRVVGNENIPPPVGHQPVPKGDSTVSTRGSSSMSSNDDNNGWMSKLEGLKAAPKSKSAWRVRLEQIKQASPSRKSMSESATKFDSSPSRSATSRDSSSPAVSPIRKEASPLESDDPTATLRSEVQRAQAEADSFRRKYEEATARLRAQEEAETERSLLATTDLQNKLRLESTRAFETLEAALKSKNTELETTNEALLQLRTECDAKEDKVADLEQDLSKLRLAAVEARRERESLVEERDVLSSENGTLMKAQTQLESENRALEEERAQLESKHRALAEEHARLESKNQEWIDERAHLESKNRAFTEERIRLESENRALMDERDDLQSKNRELIDERAHLESKHQEWVDERAHLESKNRSLAEERSTIASERDELQTANRALTKERDELQSNNRVLSEECNGLQSRNQVLTGERDGFESKCRMLQQERERLVGECDGLLAKSRALEQEQDQLAQERDELLSKSHALQRERDQLVQERDELLSNNLGLPNERESITSKYDELLSKYQALLHERDDLKVQNKMATVERDEIRGKVTSLEEALTGFQTESEKLQAELSRSQAGNNPDDEDRLAFEKVLDELQAENEKLSGLCSTNEIKYQEMETRYVRDTTEWQELLENATKEHELKTEMDQQRITILESQVHELEETRQAQLKALQSKCDVIVDKHQAVSETQAWQAELEARRIASLEKQLEQCTPVRCVNTSSWKTPVSSATHESMEYSMNGKSTDMSKSSKNLDKMLTNLTMSFDDITKERDEILAEINEPPEQDFIPDPVQSYDDLEDGNSTLNSRETSMLNEDISTLHNLTDIVNGSSSQANSSALEQLEVLSVEMHKAESRSNTPSRRSDLNPWPKLVDKLEARLLSVEHERDEIKRITDKIMSNQQATHQLQVEVAVASAIRTAKCHYCERQLLYRAES